MKVKILLSLIVYIFYVQTLDAQWRNRYPKSNGGGHHVYLEGFDLPIMNTGCTDPTPSPTSSDILFASKGFLWLLDESGTAKRITKTGSVDARPNWSNDGTKIVFVRDNSLDTVIILKDMISGEEKVLVNSKGMELDPIFSNDDKYVYYACSENQHFDIYKINIENLQITKITSDKGMERLPMPVKGTNDFIFLKKTGFSDDSFEYYNSKTNTYSEILSENFMSQASYDLHPDGRTLVYAWPHETIYEIRLTDINKPHQSVLLTQGNGLPLTPKFSANGKWVYYSQPNSNEYHELKKISVHGGEIKGIIVKKWDWETETYPVKFTTKVNDKLETVRVHLKDEKGHPFFPKNINIHQEGQSGKVFFYISKNTSIELPEGNYTLTAVKGFETKTKTFNFEVGKGKSNSVTINLDRFWNARKNNWYSSDNHYHLNYGGTNLLTPEDMIIELKGEGLDFGFPLVANLHNKLLDRELISWERKDFPMLKFGQETRSHFLGHLNVFGIDDVFWPWMWGPSYSVYGREDITNAEVSQFAEANGGVAGYVHPLINRDLMSERGMKSIPTGLVADFVLDDTKMLEIACLWTDEIATSNLLYKLLSIGKPVILSGGSDIMNDYYRTMAIGSARVYVKIDEEPNIPSFIKNLKAGKTVVSSGPMLEFKVDNKEVGEVIKTRKKEVNFELKLHTAIPINKIEILCNGEVVKNITPKKGENTTYTGSLKVPVGGWVLARVIGDKTEWPVMESYPFAQTSPIWYHKKGSTEPIAKKSAAKDLLKILDVNEKDLLKGYKNNNIPKLKSHFAKARKKLNDIINE